MKRFKLKKITEIIEKKPWIVFLFFTCLIFIIFQSLFSSYFEADEWVHFTYYLPLVEKPNGFLTSIISTFVNTGFLTGEGQHINPIGTAIFFLNTEFFGLNYGPYAFMSLLLHAINSYLVFLLIKTLLHKKEIIEKNIFSFFGGIFFALAPTPLHTITGAAPFYSYNVLSVTFFLLCVISFKSAFLKKQKKFIYLSSIFLFLALFSKETTAFLFILLPFIVLIEKRVFSFKFLGVFFFLCVVVYVFLRFFLPNMQVLSGQVIDKTFEPSKIVDDRTVVSSDLSIHKNLPAEIIFRTMTFPIRMMGTIFVPRQIEFSVVQFFAPIVYPSPSGDDIGRSQVRLQFVYGPGNDIIIYVISIGIFVFCIAQLKSFTKRKQLQEARALALGVAITIFSALPLVAVIFSFPRWGYDTYFDSRHYYNPNVGAAIIFPFLLFSFATLLNKLLHVKKTLLVACVLFIVWFIYNMQILSLSINQFIPRYSSDRRKVVEQIKELLPRLPQKAVFYTETDGLSAYGPELPFQTSVPQALTVVYYDSNHLPDSFFNKYIFDLKPEGYQYNDGRGFGYYKSKKSLADALVANKFSVDDIYSFYYYAQKVKLIDTTTSLRSEMKKYLEERKKITDWKSFEISPSTNETVKFLYPPDTAIIDNSTVTVDEKVLKDLQIISPEFTASLKVIRIAPALDMISTLEIFGKLNNSEGVITKKVMFDSYNFNIAFTITAQNIQYYILQFDDILLTLSTQNTDQRSLEEIEKILGSIIFDKKQ